MFSQLFKRLTSCSPSGLCLGTSSERPFHTFLRKTPPPNQPVFITSPQHQDSLLFFTNLSFFKIVLIIYCFLFIIYFPPTEFKVCEDREFVLFTAASEAQRKGPAHASIPCTRVECMNGQNLSRQLLRMKERNQRACLCSSQPEPLYSLIQKGCLQQYWSTSTINNTVISFVCEDHSNNSPSQKHMVQIAFPEAGKGIFAESLHSLARSSLWSSTTCFLCEVCPGSWAWSGAVKRTFLCVKPAHLTGTQTHNLGLVNTML